MEKIKKIIGIVGLPGSGKTFLGNELLSIHDNSFLIDDISMVPYALEVLDNAIMRYDVVIFTDPMCCREDVFNSANAYLRKKYPSVILEWSFFENSKDECLENVKIRSDGRAVDSSVTEMSKIYNPPSNSIKVFKRGM